MRQDAKSVEYEKPTATVYASCKAASKSFYFAAGHLPDSLIQQDEKHKSNYLTPIFAKTEKYI